MKNIFLVISIVLCLFTRTYGVNDNAAGNEVLKGLPDLNRLETSSGFEEDSRSSSELLQVLNEQEKLIQALNSHIYYGSINYSDIDSKTVYRLVNGKSSGLSKSPLFAGAAYKGYYEARARKALNEYERSGILSLDSVTSDSRAIFDGYMNSLDKGEGENTVLLLQYKLLDRLLYDNAYNAAADREKYFSEILALRKPDKAASEKRQDYIYQLFESRARLELLEQVTDRNRQVICDKAKNIGIKLLAKNEYKAYIESNGEADEAEKHVPAAAKYLQFIKGQDYNWTVLPLAEFISPNGSRSMNMTAQDGSMAVIPGEAALSYVYIDDKAQLCLDLDQLMADRGKISELYKTVLPQNTEAADIKRQEAALAAECTGKNGAGSLVVKALNKYSIYLDSKNSAPDSSYIKSFESSKKSWQSELEKALKAYEPADKTSKEELYAFIGFNKKLADFEAGYGFEGADSNKAVLKYREQVLQFRTLQSGSLWLLDMAYELWSKGEI